jgi:hypothetical protein
MRGHWDQIGQRATCPNKYKSKSKNQNLSCQQAQNSDLIDFQIPFQIDLNKFISTSLKSSSDTLFLTTLHNYHT